MDASDGIASQMFPAALMLGATAETVNGARGPERTRRFRFFDLICAVGLVIYHGPMAHTQDVELLVRAEHWDPFAVLGPHPVSGNGHSQLVVRAFLPEASEAAVV